MPDSFELKYSGPNSFDEYMQALDEQGWEIRETARKLLEDTGKLIDLNACMTTDRVYCTRLDKILTEQPNIAISEISKIPRNSTSPDKGKYPCWPQAVCRLCLDLRDKIGDAKIYIYTTVVISGKAAESVFLLEDLGFCHALDLLEANAVIEKTERSYLIRA